MVCYSDFELIHTSILDDMSSEVTKSSTMNFQMFDYNPTFMFWLEKNDSRGHDNNGKIKKKFQST